MIFQDAGASLSPIRTIGAQIHESIAAHKKMTKEEAKKPGTCSCLQSLVWRTEKEYGTAIPLNFRAE